MNYRAVAHAFFEHGRKRGLVASNPVGPVQKSKVIDKAPEFFAPDELEKLLNAGPAGRRTEEMMGLEWADVDRVLMVYSKSAALSGTGIVLNNGCGKVRLV